MYDDLTFLPVWNLIDLYFYFKIVHTYTKRLLYDILYEILKR